MTQLVATPVSETPVERVPKAPVPAITHVVRLNAFQLLMRRWSQLHPYNAGQVMEVSGVPDAERWQAAVEGVLGEMGFGAAKFSRKDRIAHFSSRGEVHIETASQDLIRFFCEELNRAFKAGDCSIRFCILTRPERDRPVNAASGSRGASHYFAAVYDHWVADSRAMRELMRRVFERYQQPNIPTPLPSMTLQAPRFVSLFRHHVGWLTRWAAIRESTKNVWRHRQGYRVNLREPLNFESHFLFRHLPEGLIEQVHRFAKGRHASVNDVFIAALGQTMGAFTHEQRKRRQKKRLHFPRTQIGIGTIVDIRDAASKPLDRVFNLYLSSYTVALQDPECVPLESLLSTVSETTSRMKRTFATVKSFWALAAARLVWDYSISARYRSQMLHKMVPVIAGISNVNMTDTWADFRHEKTPREGVPQVLDYFRISPTGPLLPLVFTLTTIGNRLSLCVTYRTTAFDDKQAQKLAADFVGRLEAVG